MSDNKKAEIEKEYCNTLHIQTLGDFTLKYKNNILSGEKIRSKQVWNLLEYLIANRYKDSSLDKLMDVLWGESEIDDPSNALKNLAYRLRSVLNEKLDINAGEYIVKKRDSYAWNLDAKYIIDVDILEKSVKNANAKFMSEDDVFFRYMHAVEIYKGGFMPQSAYKEWAISLAVYYQNLYMEAVERVCEILLNRYDYAKTEEICRTAILQDESVEINHANLIKALIGMKDNKKALEHYNYVSKYFYDEFGIRPSNIITDLYSDIADKKSGYEKNIATIKNDLKEANEVTGTMYCNYETFKAIYRLQARAASRNGRSFFVVLLTAKPKISSPTFEKNTENILEKILNIIFNFLRKDDIVARCGYTQFVLMLSNITYENTVKAMHRLNEKICKSDIGKFIEINSQIETLDPVELEDSNV